MTEAITKNWLTTVAGLLAGVPALLAGAGILLPPGWQKFATLCGGIGVLLLGVTAKQWNNHSTLAQVEQATVATAPAETVQTVEPLPRGGMALTTTTVTDSPRPFKRGPK